MADDAPYTGTEPAVPWTGEAADRDGVYIIRPPGVPSNAVAIYDEDLRAVIGFRVGLQGVFRVFDLNGTMVDMYELPLESPLIDPIDLLLVVGALFRSALKAGARTLRQVGTSGVRGIAATLNSGALALLRATFRSVAASDLKFTAKTAARMAEKGRQVPVQILALAIRHGKRVPDPQGVAGAFEYTIPMVRNNVQYMLKVVLREADRTILHFHYF